MSPDGTPKPAARGTVSGAHPAIPVFPTTVPVAPSTSGQRNTIRAGIFPIACWRVEDLLFDFDSSFIRPDMKDEIGGLADLVAKHEAGGRKPAFSVFGHADPVGKEGYNKKLSGRRAIALYGLLTRDADLWEELYSDPLGRDDWGLRRLQVVLDATGHPPGRTDGVMDGSTRSALKDFQSGHDLKVDGKPGPDTRRALFLAYMDALCGDLRFEKSDGLARGADSGGKGDYQGCGEFNPAMLFSKEEEKKFSKPANEAERNQENAPNRRVVVLLFRPGSRVNPERWPCPRAREGVAGCKARFHSDGDRRRNDRKSGERREYKETHDTFACRFYDRIATGSPCEGAAPVLGASSWITECPDAGEAEVVLVVRDRSGTEVCRIPASSAAPGPDTYRTFDLAVLDPSATHWMELFVGERLLAPAKQVTLGPLRAAILAGKGESASQHFRPAGEVAPPAKPLKEVEGESFVVEGYRESEQDL